MTRIHWTRRRMRWAALGTPVALCALVLILGGLSSNIGRVGLGRKAGV